MRSPFVGGVFCLFDRRLEKFGLGDPTGAGPTDHDNEQESREVLEGPSVCRTLCLFDRLPEELDFGHPADFGPVDLDNQINALPLWRCRMKNLRRLSRQRRLVVDDLPVCEYK